MTERYIAVQIIAGSLKHIDLEEDELVAVRFEKDWYPGQFISHAETAKVRCTLDAPYIF